MMQMSNKGHNGPYGSHTQGASYANNVNMNLGGNRVIQGMAPVTLVQCPGASNGATQPQIWTQNIIPIAHHVRTTTRNESDRIRGDIHIQSQQGPVGWFHSSKHNLQTDRGARAAVFGVN